VPFADLEQLALLFDEEAAPADECAGDGVTALSAEDENRILR
jgi:hypothetical protein